MNVNYNDSHKRKTTCTFLYTKSKKNCETFLHTKSRILFKKQDSFRYVFIYKRHDNIRYAIFHENFEVGIYMKKAWHFAIREFFICKKPDTSKKVRQFALRFYIQKSRHFVLRGFSLDFWNWWRRGGGISINKNNPLCITYIYRKKTINFELRSYIQKSSHVFLLFYIQKTMHFALRFYI